MMDKKITIVDFKRAFADVFRFSPYPEWVKTTYDTGDEVNYNGASFRSLVDNNSTEPSRTDSENWEVLDNYITDLPDWVQPIAYNAGDIVIYLDEKDWQRKAYSSARDNNFNSPGDIDSGWVIDSSVIFSKYVNDSMIDEAFLEAAAILPKDGISEFAEYKQVFLLLAAHFLVMDWQAKNSGMSPSGTSGIITSRRISDFSATYAINPILSQYPQYSMLTTTYWGQKALMLLSRHWVGNIVFVGGAFTSY